MHCALRIGRLDHARDAAARDKAHRGLRRIVELDDARNAFADGAAHRGVRDGVLAVKDVDVPFVLVARLAFVEVANDAGELALSRVDV